MQRRKAVLQEFSQSTAGTVSAFCMNCPDEILSVLMFPDDHVSVQMLRSYFTMALSADTLKDFARLTSPSLRDPLAPCCSPWFSHTASSPGFHSLPSPFLGSLQKLSIGLDHVVQVVWRRAFVVVQSLSHVSHLRGDASVGQMGFLWAQTPSSHLLGCHAPQFGGQLPHLQLGTVPSGPEGEFECSVCFCTFIKI